MTHEDRSTKSPHTLRDFVSSMGIDAEAISRIKLSGGIVGRTILAMIGVCAAVAWIAVAASNVWISGASLIVILVCVVFCIHKAFSFARENPAAAILEGAEFLAHQRIVLESKHGVVQGELLTPSTDPSLPVPTVATMPELPESAGIAGRLPEGAGNG